MSDEPKLLPCPFCGGEASAEGYQRWTKPCPDMTWSNGEPVTEAYFCNCPSCGVANTVSDVGHQTRADAIAAWNRRVPAPAVPDDVAGLVAELRSANPDEHCNDSKCKDAAATIEALAASVDRANAANEALCADVEAQAAELARLKAENDDLKSSVIAFCAPWAVQHARDAGLPKGHLHPTHYDILERAGGRMDSFTRAALTQPTGDRT
ncbi:Lar family restriction alleviation protein [Paracoccus sp. SY]|uniref:Lar family restriction alleviation protein n=1 Tax=Paracoccus sp. SY TaxID=1330255 RepID=UPI001304A45E|nr:Lar family restriction alleviation protein [Paracoccus sp. SY]